MAIRPLEDHTGTPPQNGLLLKTYVQRCEIARQKRLLDGIDLRTRLGHNQLTSSTRTNVLIVWAHSQRNLSRSAWGGRPKGGV